MNLVKLGKLIKHGRNMKGLTQEELAKRIYAQSNTISQYENGKRLPETRTLILLCKELELLPTELFTGKRIKNEQARKELLSMIREDNILNGADERDGKSTFDFTGYLVVTPDRKGHLSDVWIPYEDKEFYTQEEIYSLQERDKKRAVMSRNCGMADGRGI